MIGWLYGTDFGDALCKTVNCGYDTDSSGGLAPPGTRPGGHASEDALSPFVAEGDDHAVWGADVVLLPLNLCAETLDGVRNHSWSRPAPATPEGEVVSWADRIAYVCHDFEDAARAGNHADKGREDDQQHARPEQGETQGGVAAGAHGLPGCGSGVLL